MHAPLLEGTFTVADYHRLAERGILDEDDRVELLDGRIVVMTPIGARHVACVIRLNSLLSRHWSSDTSVSVQNPVALAEGWEPQPDIAVLRRPAGLSGAWLPAPEDIVLLIEVADTSLERDRETKVPRYAAAGIPEVWLVDLAAERITLHRTPGTDGYREVTCASRGERISAQLLPGVTLTVDDILG